MIKSLSECRTACWIIIAIAGGGVLSEINRPSTSMVLFLSIIIVAGIAALSLGRDIQEIEDRDEAERQARPDQSARQVEELRKLLRQR
ncbi:hypothetical protein [Mesorhizobium sp. A556]